MLRKKKSLFIGVFVVILAIVGVWWWLTASNQGTVTQVSSPVAKKAAVPRYKTLNGVNFTLRYLGIYAAKQLPASDNDLEIYQLTADTTYTKQLAVSVSRLPGGNLANNSAYLLRQSQTSTYTEQHLVAPAGTADVWFRQDGTEETAFLVRGEQVATLAFTQQGGTAAALQAEVQNVLNTFTWR
jgi:hypothetical protein